MVIVKECKTKECQTICNSYNRRSKEKRKTA